MKFPGIVPYYELHTQQHDIRADNACTDDIYCMGDLLLFCKAGSLDIRPNLVMYMKRLHVINIKGCNLIGCCCPEIRHLPPSSPKNEGYIKEPVHTTKLDQDIVTVSESSDL